MEIIFILLLILGLITLIGHGTWLLLAWVLKALAGPSLTTSERVVRHKSRGNGELHELEITERQLRKLQQAGTLDSAAVDPVYRCIEARRKILLTPALPVVAAAAVQPKQPPTQATEPPVLPLWERLQQLLASCPDVTRLSLKQRQHILLWYPQVAEDRLASLSPAAQLALARLFTQLRRTDDALRAYRRLLEHHPHDSEWAGWAFEAGRFAAEKKISDQACAFVEKALSGDLSAEKRQEAERLLQSLRGPAKVEVADRVPPRERASEPKAERPSGPDAAALPVPRPRRSIALLLAAFMEEHNIFWGELVGGLLMVGCSIALVIYLWKDLERIPYFQFLIFVGTTASVFGAGLYARHRLKLETTSRGLLLIATLLVPLNFLVMAGLAGQQTDAGSYDTVLRIGIEILSLAVFAGFMHWAAPALVPHGRGLLILTVLGVSASPLAVPRFLGAPVAARGPALLPFVLLGCLPVAFYGLGTAGYLRRLSGRRPINHGQATALFTFLGVATFPLTVALGFLVYWSDDVGVALERLAVLVALSGTPALAGGLLVNRHLQSAQETESGGAIRTIGTAVALTGMLIMLAAVVLAWPQATAMILVCALNFAVLTAVAFSYREPVAHVAALPCLAAGYLVAFHLLWGHVSPEALSAVLLQRFLSAQSGSALVVLVLLLRGAARMLVRDSRREHASYYVAAAGVAAFVSLALVNIQGISNPGPATIVTGIYAIAGLALNWPCPRILTRYLGLALVLATTLWALWWANAALTPAWGTVLALEALVMAAVAAWTEARVRGGENGSAGSDRHSRPLRPLAWRDTAAAAGFLALALAGASMDAITSSWHTATGGVLVVTTFLLALLYRSRLLVWGTSALLLAMLLHGFTWGFGISVAHPAAVAVLAHATLVLLVSLILADKVHSPKGESAVAADRSLVPPLILEPLFQSALSSSLAALPILLLVAWNEPGPLAAYLAWLSAVWLGIAYAKRWPGLFAAFQAALTGSVLLAATAWLEGQAWVIGHYPEALSDPRSLQAYGVALGLLGLFWLAARLALRSNNVMRELSEPAWPAVDWVVLGLLVLAQCSLAVWGILPGVLAELTPVGTPLELTWPPSYVHTYGPGAWLLLGVLTIVLSVALWERELTDAVVGLVILAVTASLLLAGPFEKDLATASALRWSLAGCFLACSIPLWLRNSLARFAQQLKCFGDPAASLARMARGLLIAASVIPVLGLTLAVAAIGFSHQQPRGPVPGSFFADIGWVASHIVPLAMLGVGLVGHAVRERSPGYAFSAGLVVNLAVTGGYALSIVTSGQALGGVECVQLLQLATITAALWAVAWLASHPWIPAWREEPTGRRAAPLMKVQLGLATLGNALVLVPALAFLVTLFPTPVGWTAEAGAPLGWLAFVLASAAWCWRRLHSRTPLKAYTAGLIGMAVVGLLACSTARQWPAWGYRALMLGWACYAPALVLLAWECGKQERPSRLPALRASCSSFITAHAVAFWVRVAGVLVVLLGLKAALAHEDDHLWAAGAIALAGSAEAVMAVWRRREDRAFTAGLGVNLAASLVVWHFYQHAALADWWILLLQVNVLATSSVALLWLGMRQQIYRQTELRLATGPLLAVQVCLGIAGMVVLLVFPLSYLVAQPGEPLPPELLAVGYPSGWLALGLATAALFSYAGQVAPKERGHILAVLGMALGVLAACSASLWAPPGSWVAYHVLLAAWTGTGLVILTAEYVAELQHGQLAEFSSFPVLAKLLAFSPSQFRAWLNAIGLLVLGLALRGTWEDPAKPFWSAGATLAVSAMAGAIAVRSQLPVYAHISGLLINVAGGILWVVWGAASPAGFAYTQVLCFALAAGMWTVVELTVPRHPAPGGKAGRLIAFRHLGAFCAVSLFAALAAWSVALDVLGSSLEEAGTLAWAALGATAVTLLISLWDRDAKYNLSGLYAVGLAAMGLALHSMNLEPKDLGLTASLALAFYALLTTGVARLAPHVPGLWQELQLPSRARAWPETWFHCAQAALAFAGVLLSVWLSLGAATLEERLVGSLTLAILLPTGVLLAGGASGKWASALRHATLVLGVVLAAEAGWAVLGPSVPALWLHRHVLLMAAFAVTTVVYGVGFVRVLPPTSNWTGSARQLGPVLGALACIMLLLVLGHEVFLYHADLGRTPMMPWAILLVAAALAGLIVAGISFAVMPGRELFGLSERGRMLYVYAGEVLLALLFVHLRLTVPELFRLGIFSHYWPFIVMAIAFVGVGLSEFLGRKGLRVLAEPLQRTGVFLPLLPLLSFWVVPAAQAQTQRLLDPDNYGRYAALWFLAGSLYTLLAATRRSFRFALVAALSANFGLWALLVHSHVDFLSHPQMWLIPFALIVLAAEYLNRERLPEQQGNALRYLALLVIYLSSTADMFIAGLGHSVLLPLVLAVLSVLGVLSGILLRVRAFLYLGVTFLFLVIFTMIWHAAVGQHQIWVWWASGIVLGAGIIALFAFFEKRRNDVLRMLEEIKKWH